ncbi:MAG: hypothetical protein ACREFP_13125 [Acetobacteraceae bacterium]
MSLLNLLALIFEVTYQHHVDNIIHSQPQKISADGWSGERRRPQLAVQVAACAAGTGKSGCYYGRLRIWSLECGRTAADPGAPA